MYTDYLRMTDSNADVLFCVPIDVCTDSTRSFRTAFSRMHITMSMLSCSSKSHVSVVHRSDHSVSSFCQCCNPTYVLSYLDMDRYCRYLISTSSVTYSTYAAYMSLNRSTTASSHLLTSDLACIVHLYPQLLHSTDYVNQVSVHNESYCV
jgi:hypothetical protein